MNSAFGHIEAISRPGVVHVSNRGAGKYLESSGATASEIVMIKGGA